MFNSPPSSHSLLSVAATATWLSAHLTAPAAMAIEFQLGHTSPFRVEEATRIEVEFVESHGAYQSGFGILDLETGEVTILLTPESAAGQVGNVFAPSTFVDDFGSPLDFLGSPGVTVERSLGEFTLEPGRDYTFILESMFEGRDAGSVYFLDELNPNGERLAVVENEVEPVSEGDGSEDSEEEEDSCEPVLIFWEDTGGLLVAEPDQDRDFDDYIVKVQEDCPIVGVLPAAPLVAAAGPSLAGLGALGLLPLGIIPFVVGGDPPNDDPPTMPPPTMPPPTMPPPTMPPPTMPPPTPIPFEHHTGMGILALGAFVWMRHRRNRLRS